MRWRQIREHRQFHFYIDYARVMLRDTSPSDFSLESAEWILGIAPDVLESRDAILPPSDSATSVDGSEKWKD